MKKAFILYTFFLLSALAQRTDVKTKDQQNRKNGQYKKIRKIS